MLKDLLSDRETLYSAVANKDSSFEGLFFFAVKSTGIFCRPTCTARKPNPQNVEYFASTREALNHGYRPCKVCHPMTPYGEIPGWLSPLLKEIQQQPGIRLTDDDLRMRGADPARVRRWFKKHHNMTFHAYLRSHRISKAFGQIKRSETVTASAFDSGFDSLSGFGDAFKKATGFAPSQSRDKGIISIKRLLTPIGPLIAGATDEGICLLEFTDRHQLETQLSRLKKAFRAAIIPGENRHFAELERQLEAYFSGELQTFTVPLLTPATDFQQSAWRALQAIPYGETRSYQEQAASLGNPKAVRAVATANGHNRIAIIIPCHRVIGKDGTLTGYAGGLWRKQYLLDLESNPPRP